MSTKKTKKREFYKKFRSFLKATPKFIGSVLPWVLLIPNLLKFFNQWS